MTRFSGVVTEQEVSAYREELRKNPEFQVDFDELMIGRETITTHYSFEQFSYDPADIPFGKGSRRALVVGGNQYTEERAKIIKTRQRDAPYEMRIFRDEAEARRWLGLA